MWGNCSAEMIKLMKRPANLPLDKAPTKSGSGHSSPPSSAEVLSRTMASIGATCDSGSWSMSWCSSSPQGAHTPQDMDADPS
jgi:hypothetical protein